LVSEPIPEIDSKLGLLPSGSSWFMKQRFFMNSYVLELLTTSTLVMLSSPRITSCSGDAITSSLEIKPNQTDVQWQGKTLDYKFFQSLHKLVQLTIFSYLYTPSMSTKSWNQGTNYSTTDDAQTGRNNLELTNGHAQCASKIAWIVCK
jgi:hypothetical protein